MPVRTFADTNIHIYAHSKSVNPNDIAKRDMALKMLDECHLVISTQVIREFTTVMTGSKGNQSIDQVEVHVEDMIGVAEMVVEEDLKLIRKAFEIHRKYKFGFYDSLIISAALFSDCAFLLSEDMNHGQVIDGTLTIVNPFYKQNPQL